MDITIDARTMSPMLGRLDVYRALLDSLRERPGPGEPGDVLKLRLRRAFQGHDLTVRLAHAERRVPAELAFIERTLAELHPRATLLRGAPPGAPPPGQGPSLRPGPLSPSQA